jgi:hypothetical protein
VGKSLSPALTSALVLVSCPFCHDLVDGRDRRSCSVCGIALVPLHRVSPSTDELDVDGMPLQPEHDPLPVTFLGRGRGPLAVLALAGVAAFLSPWVKVTLPDIVTYSGFALARRLGWVWAAGIAWCVLAPTVVSRRSIARMRGARLAAAFLSAIPGVSALVLLGRPPHGSHGVPLRFAFGAGVYITLGLSALALVVSLAFGGRSDDLRLRRGSSRDQVLH